MTGNTRRKKSLNAMRDFFRFFSSYDACVLARRSSRAIAQDALFRRRPLMWTGHAAA
jgi:hypothetical protein